MAQINKPDLYFNTKLYTGDDTNNRQISLDFSPDFLWIKGRNVGYSHILFDRVRTNANYLITNATSAEQDGSSLLGWTNTGCTTNSFTIDKGSNGSINNSGDTYVAWNWLAGGTASSNTDGSITSSVSANTTSGFSIVSYTGNGSDNATIGHGLGSSIDFVIVKRRNTTSNWLVQGSKVGTGYGQYLELNSTGAISTASDNIKSVSSSTLTLGTNGSCNGSSDTYVAYCFAEKQGYSKFGSYTGNGNADGPFVYTGFKPAFVLVDNINQADDWYMFDNKRSSFNQVQANLKPNTSSTEASSTSYAFDFLSNGFKLRSSTGAVNNNGDTLIYMAFAENPLVGTNNIPATAR